MDVVEQKLLTCMAPYAVTLWRQDNLYRDLEGIIAILGTLRDERKNLIFVTENMPGSTGSRRVGGSGGGGGGAAAPPECLLASPSQSAVAWTYRDRRRRRKCPQRDRRYQPL